MSQWDNIRAVFRPQTAGTASAYKPVTSTVFGGGGGRATSVVYGGGGGRATAMTSYMRPLTEPGGEDILMPYGNNYGSQNVYQAYQQSDMAKNLMNRRATGTTGAATGTTQVYQPLVQTQPAAFDYLGQARELTSGTDARRSALEARLAGASNTQSIKDSMAESDKYLGQYYGKEREKAVAANEAQRQRMQQALQERLAAQGFTRGTGMLEGAERTQATELAKSLAGALGDVSQQEMGAREQRSAEERARMFTREERVAAQAQQSLESLDSRNNQLQISALSNAAAENRINLQDSLNQASEIRKGRTDNLYNQGRAGVDIDVSNLSPLEQDAYNMGKSGMTYDDYVASRDANIEYRKALITRLDPDSADFQEELTAIYNTLGIDPLTGETIPPGERTKPTPPSPAKDFSGAGYKETSGNNQWNFTEQPPEVGQAMYVGGKKYTVSSPMKLSSPWWSQDTQWFTVKDPTTGKEYAIVPSGAKGEVKTIKGYKGPIIYTDGTSGNSEG